MCARVCAYVCRMCLSALFPSMLHLDISYPFRELFVGSEYASVYERMCSSVMLQGLGEKHLLMLKTTTRNVLTFDKNEKNKSVN